MRFIIVSVPPDPPARDLLNLQQRLSAGTGAVEVLRYPPHVTLRTGIVCPDDAVDAAIRAFLDHASTLAAVSIRSTGLLASGYRDANGVERGFLGYQVELSPELLELHQGLLEFNQWQKGPQGVFDPHISLCYHDITPQMVRSILEEYRAELETLEPAWEAGSVDLYVSVDKSWRYHARAMLLQHSS